MTTQEFDECLHILKDGFSMEISTSPSPRYTLSSDYYMKCFLGIYTINPQRMKDSADYGLIDRICYIYDLFGRSIFLSPRPIEYYGVPYGYLKIYDYNNQNHHAYLTFAGRDENCPFLSMEPKEFISFMQYQYGFAKKICSILSSDNYTTLLTSRL